MFQVNQEKYKNLSNGFKLTYQEGGARNLFLGWAPTAIGYAAQGKKKAFSERALNVWEFFLVLNLLFQKS